MISCSQAHQCILEHVQACGTERLPLSEAAGRILRESVFADRDAPPFDRVMMDGFAVKAGRNRYILHGRVHAGESSPPLSDLQGAVEVMTGCVLPVGADAVVPIEDVRVEDGVIHLEEPASPGQFIHQRGNEGLAGRMVLEPGVLLNPARLAIAATEGATELEVNARVRIWLVTTGDEVVPVSDTPEAWQIRGSHAEALRAMLNRNGDVDFHHVHVPDKEFALDHAIREGMEQSDILLLCGGMSKGRRDYVPHRLRGMGASEHFHFVAQRPGKPMGFWTHGQTAVFGLPGNPLAVLSTARRHVVPALDAWRGAMPVHPPHVRVYGRIQAQTRFTTFQPVRLVAEGAVPLSVSNSGSLHALAEGDGFVELSPGDDKDHENQIAPFWAWI